MLNNRQNINNTSIQSETTVIATNKMPLALYYGRVNEISQCDQDYKDLLKKLISIHKNFINTSSATKDRHWNVLVKQISELINELSYPNHIIKQYQCDLLLDGLLPYLEKLNNRLFTDIDRFQQIETIFNIISNNSTQHPVVTLQALDLIIDEIKSNHKYLFKSELLILIEKATMKQWQPIINEYRSILQNVGGKLMILGIVGSIGWPLLFLYPMYKTAITLSAIILEYEQHKRLTYQSLFDAAQLLLLVYATMQLMNILTMYASVGYASGFLGSVMLYLSLDIKSLKVAIPILAPHMLQMHQLLEKLNSIDIKHIASTIQNLINKQHTALDHIHTAATTTKTGQEESFVESSRIKDVTATDQSYYSLSGTSKKQQIYASKNIVNVTNISEERLDEVNIDAFETMTTSPEEEDKMIYTSTETMIGRSNMMKECAIGEIDTYPSGLRKRNVAY